MPPIEKKVSIGDLRKLVASDVAAGNLQLLRLLSDSGSHQAGTRSSYHFHSPFITTAFEISRLERGP